MEEVYWFGTARHACDEQYWWNGADMIKVSEACEIMASQVMGKTAVLPVHVQMVWVLAVDNPIEDVIGTLKAAVPDKS